MKLFNGKLTVLGAAMVIGATGAAVAVPAVSGVVDAPDTAGTATAAPAAPMTTAAPSTASLPLNNFMMYSPRSFGVNWVRSRS